MKYLKKFDMHSDYETYINSQDKTFPNISYCEIENEVHFNKYSVDYSKLYVRTKALESGTISFNIPSGLGTLMFQSIDYSLDNGKTWTTTSNLNSTSIKVDVNVNKGDKILWRGIGNLTGYVKDSLGHYYGAYFSSTARFIVDGNIMSLTHGDNFENYTSITYEGLFAGLFYSKYNNDSTLVVSAKNLYLPSVLGRGCYHSMFYNCTSLIYAPELPATVLEYECYAYMFQNCTALMTAPKLPATTLTNYCYAYMFWGCTSLITAPVLSATTLANWCYIGMFRECTSLTTPPSILPATTLTSACYSYMFYGCTSLTIAPELPATTLETLCYESMFYNCTSLTTAPELSATTLINRCYAYMFNGCSSLNYIKAMFTTTPSTSCTNSWVEGVAATGTFVKNSNAEWNVTGVHGVPSGWTVQTSGTFVS